MKKIAVSTIKSFLKEYENEKIYRHTILVDGKECVIEFNYDLSVNEWSMFLNRVAGSCFDGEGVLRPEYIRPMVYATILQMCSNVPTLVLRKKKGDNDESLMDVSAMSRVFEIIFESLEAGDSFGDPATRRFRCFVYEIESKCNEFIYNSIKENDAAARNAFVAMCGELLETVESVKSTFTQVSQLLDAVGTDKLSAVASAMSKLGLDDETEDALSE